MEIKLLLSSSTFLCISTSGPRLDRMSATKENNKLNIRIFKHSLSVAAVALFALAATPSLHASSACPTPLSTSSGADGSSGGEPFDQGYLNIIAASPSTANISCNVLITIAANGSISTTNPNGNGFYDEGGDDNVVGVINNSSTPLSSLNLSSVAFEPFGFDGDGFCGGYNFAAGPNCGNQQGSTANNNYLPQGVTATNINFDGSSGTINFLTAIAGGGGTGWFSLEDPVDVNLVITSGPTVPEPSTLLMMGTGIAGFAGMLRRKFGK